MFFVFCGSLLAQDIPDTKVRYLSGNTVYLAGGANIGLQIGDQLDVKRSEEVIARIEVTYLATGSASCKILSQEKDIMVGDVVQWISGNSGVVKEDTTLGVRVREIPEKPASVGYPESRTYISGGASLQWYHRTDNTAAGLNFNQWSARVSLRIRNLWVKDLNLKLNTRARFNRRTSAFGGGIPEEEWQSRLYWISIAYESADAPFGFQAGRITSNKFSGLGYIDGLILQHNLSKSFNWGLFGGVQPDMRSVNFSTDLQKYGVYGSYRSGTYNSRYVQTTLALAGSYTQGEVNREYAYFEFRITDRSGWRIHNSLEIDYNRAWRKEYAGSALALTGLYFSGSYEFSESVTAGLGYDNRKNYLTYVYYSKPQELFEEAQRQSLRADVRIRVPSDVTISLRGGLRDGQDDARISHNYGITLVKSGLLLKNLQATLAFTGFSTLYNQGFSPTASVRYQLGPASLSAAYGAYRYTLSSVDERRGNQYVNLTFNLPVWASLYLFGHYYYDWGDDMQGHRVLTEFGYRF
jgi:hypothetical protein